MMTSATHRYRRSSTPSQGRPSISLVLCDRACMMTACASLCQRLALRTLASAWSTAGRRWAACSAAFLLLAQGSTGCLHAACNASLALAGKLAPHAVTHGSVSNTCPANARRIACQVPDRAVLSPSRHLLIAVTHPCQADVPCLLPNCVLAYVFYSWPA